jgi:hypothetical protein
MRGVSSNFIVYQPTFAKENAGSRNV